MPPVGHSEFQYAGVFEDSIQRANNGQAFPFTPDLMPEWSSQEGEEFKTGVTRIRDYYRDVLNHLQLRRAEHENDWVLNREYYEEAEHLKDDKNRVGSVFSKFIREQDTELDKRRFAVFMPIIFEEVQQQQARQIERLFGNDPNNYVEISAKNANDVPGARVYGELVSYQQAYLIRTQDIADDWINSSLVEGTGIVARTWNYDLNAPEDKVVDLFDYWMDPQGDDHQQDRWHVWRGTKTFADLLRGREDGIYGFSDDDIKGAVEIGLVISNRGRSRERQSNLFLDILRTSEDAGAPPELHRLVTLDVFMERNPERFIYVINEQLVIAVWANPLMIQHVEGQPMVRNTGSGQYRYPVSVLTSVRKRASKYGDSTITRLRPVQDLLNSLVQVLNENLVRSVLGLFFADPDAVDFEELDPLRINTIRDPNKNILNVRIPNATNEILGVADWFKRVFADNVHGITDPVRGSPSAAVQTATGQAQLVEQSGARIGHKEKRGREAIRDYHIIGLLLNQNFLQPDDSVRIAEENGVWRPVRGSDFMGIVGKDLIVTGFAPIGSRSFWLQQGMSLLGLLQQLKASGENIVIGPIIRRVVEAFGVPETDQIVPQPGGPGFDPRKENELMLGGAVLQTSPDDDDFFHVLTHGELLSSPEIQQLGFTQPGILQNITFHFQQHSARLAALEASAAGGGGGEQGVGVSGLNTEVPEARPKPQEELAAQTGVSFAG